jgi:hypothetical protein
VSCTAELATPGTLEVEAGYNFQGSSAVATRNFPFLLKLTLSKMLQLQVGSNGFTLAEPLLPPLGSTLYFDNLLAGAKLHLLDQGKLSPSIAITALVGIPTRTDANVDVFVTGHASKDIGALHADLNVGITEWMVDTGEPVAQGLIAFALSTSLPPPFGIALETYYLSSALPAAPNDGGVRFAISATPKPWLVFDFGGDVGFFPSVRSYTVFFGMSIVPAVFWR